MTKIDGRSKEAARQLDESLQRLQVDCIDLVQHHEIIRYEDPHRVFDEEGANAALIEAREAGKLRYIGFTGTKTPNSSTYAGSCSRAGFKFDAVLPLNVMDAHSPELREVCQNWSNRTSAFWAEKHGKRDSLRSNTVPIECLHYA